MISHVETGLENLRRDLWRGPSPIILRASSSIFDPCSWAELVLPDPYAVVDKTIRLNGRVFDGQEGYRAALATAAAEDGTGSLDRPR